MPLVVGIDEAGYGPTLGPFVVAATLWDVPPEKVRADFWHLLADCVVRKTRRGQWRLPVNDSKSVYVRKKGIGTLERTVLAFAGTAGFDCTSFDRLLAGLGSPLDDPQEMPWYRNLARPLPIDARHTRFEAVGQRLSRAMQSAEIACRGLRARVVTEDRFNDRVTQTRNKAAIVVEHVLGLIHEAGTHSRGRDLIVRVDRLGGRSDYRGLLATAFPDREMRVIEVSDEHSRYQLASTSNDWFIEFAVGADQLHLPVSLASMVAKYLREVLMLQFNNWWSRQLAGLKPTAGYYVDAQRFLHDIESAIPQAGVPRARFVRSR